MSPMLSALDHIVLICPSIEAGVSTYRTLLGREPVWQAESGGLASALFRADNTAIELLAPLQGGGMEAKFKGLLGGLEGRLTSLAFSTDDISTAHHLSTRRGLVPSDISKGDSLDISSGNTRTWQRFRCGDEVCAGVKTFILEHKEGELPVNSASTGSAASLDHVVIYTPNPERAIAHYGARLGLRFALDRTIEAFKTRFMFFRIGGLTLELVQRLERDQDPAAPDTFWGLTWKTDDLAAAHERLTDAGVAVSEIRTGRKAGTQVFTVKSGSLGIPTLFLEQIAKAG